MMTVQQLIEALSGLDPDLEVYVWDADLETGCGGAGVRILGEVTEKLQTLQKL